MGMTAPTTTTNPGVPLDTLLHWTVKPPRTFTQRADYDNLEAWLQDHARRLVDRASTEIAAARFDNATDPLCSAADICIGIRRLTNIRRQRGFA